MDKKLIFLFVLFFANCLQANVLKGVITDKATGEPLIGASVQVEGSSVGTATNLDGVYVLDNLQEKEYTLKVRYISYGDFVERLYVKGETVRDFKLEQKMLALADVEVSARRNYESENMQLLEQRRAVLAVQSVGAKELRRKGVGDAEGAVSKVSGVSKQEGVKNVFVRGLGDRYNQTMLNAFPLPSEDPEYKNISLHFFGTDIIKSIGVDKVFGAGRNAHVVGANIDISSKELIRDCAFGAQLSGGLNTNAVGSTFYKMSGTNAFGFANKAYHDGDLTKYGFANALNPSVYRAQINRSYGLSGGYRWKLGEAKSPLSFFVVVNYSTDYGKTTELKRSATVDGMVYQDQVGDKSFLNINHLFLSNLDFGMAGKHRLSYNFLFIHTNKQYSSRYDGFHADYNSGDGGLGASIRQQTNDNTLIVNQLISEWTLMEKLKMSVGAAYNLVRGLEPDRRTNTISSEGDEGVYKYMKGDGVQQRYFSDLKEHDWNGRVFFSYSLPDKVESNSFFRLGYEGRYVRDNFSATLYNQNILYQTPDADSKAVDLDAVFNQSGLDGEVFQLGKNIDQYEISKAIHSVYAESMYEFSKKWALDLGLRMDDVLQKLDYALNNKGNKGNRRINKTYWLPSANVRYFFVPDHALRLGASKTYTLPQAKEISPFRYYDVSFSSEGNKNLKPSDNYNVDLKYEWYITASELISASVFYKYITNPISRTDQANAASVLTYMNVSDKAQVAGVELEFRKNIFSRPYGEGEHRLSVGINASYIYTNCNVNLPGATEHTGTQLEGASPWIVNADLSHCIGNGKYDFTNTVVFNYYSPRVYVIGMQGFYDTMERGVPTLDFVSSAHFAKNWEMKLKVKNILNADYQLTRESDAGTIVLNRYRKGLNVSLGLSYNF